MPVFKIPVKYVETGWVEVEAPNLNDAVKAYETVLSTNLGCDTGPDKKKEVDYEKVYVNPQWKF